MLSFENLTNCLCLGYKTYVLGLCWKPTTKLCIFSPLLVNGTGFISRNSQIGFSRKVTFLHISHFAQKSRMHRTSILYSSPLTISHRLESYELWNPIQCLMCMSGMDTILYECSCFASIDIK